MSCDYAYHCCNGKVLHLVCCEIRTHRPNDVFALHSEKIAAIKVAHGINSTEVLSTGCTDCFMGETLVCEEMANQVEESTQVLPQKDPNVAEKSSNFDAHQVLDKMPKSDTDGELISLDGMAKINKELIDAIDWEATPMDSVKILNDVKALEEGELRDTIPTTHALKYEFVEQASLMSGVLNALFFDPGGNILIHRDHAMSLLDKNSENSRVEDNKLVEEEFHEFSKSFVSAGSDTRISCAEHEPQLVIERNLDEKSVALRFSMACEILANGSILCSLPNGAEVTVKELVAAYHKLNFITGQGVIKTFRDVMIVFNMGNLSFDPGGSRLTESWRKCCKLELSAALKTFAILWAGQFKDEVQLEKQNPTVQGTPISRYEDQDIPNIFKDCDGCNSSYNLSSSSSQHQYFFIDP